MFTDISYYKGGINIPNLDKDTTDFEENYIEPLEQEILEWLLGNDLYKQFKTGIEAATPDQKWRDLRDGKDYSLDIDGITYNIRWNGLVNTEKISLLSYYVYFHYVKENYQQLTGLGVITANPENGVISAPNTKLVMANNRCSELAGSYPRATTGEGITYPTTEKSLFNFILNHLDDYPNWIYRPFKKINILGI